MLGERTFGTRCIQRKIFRYTTNNHGVNIEGRIINNLRYANNMVLLVKSEKDLQEVLDEVNITGKTFGMKMNAERTRK